jgi:hypothetical protein
MFYFCNDSLTGNRACVVEIREDAHWFIPLDTDNTDYQRYLEWESEGNEPEDYATVILPVATPEGMVMPDAV